LLKVHGQVPFGFADCYELWLLDTQQRPLALLHSVTQPGDTATDHALQWRAGYLCERIFQPRGIAQFEAIFDTNNPAQYLTRYINELTRQPAQA
jgi:hypothetical protein